MYLKFTLCSAIALAEHLYRACDALERMHKLGAAAQRSQATETATYLDRLLCILRKLAQSYSFYYIIFFPCYSGNLSIFVYLMSE